MKTFLCLLIILSLAFACSEQNPLASKSNESKTVSSQAKQAIQILEQRGYAYRSYEEDGQGELILYHGDCALSFSIADILANNTGEDQYYFAPWGYQYKWAGLVSRQRARDIKVKIGKSVPRIWRTVVQQAIRTWNDKSQTGSQTIGMREVRQGQDISIGTDYQERRWIAKANLARGGKPGSNITINTYFNNKPRVNASVKLEVIVHELGHCLGFMHMGKVDGPQIHVKGTPTTYGDPNSVMYYRAHPWGNGFTKGDKDANRYCYDTIRR